MKYYVMLVRGDGYPLPLMGEYDEVVLFNIYEEAEEAGSASDMPYQVMEWDWLEESCEEY